jgi:hypothetical protein
LRVTKSEDSVQRIIKGIYVAYGFARNDGCIKGFTTDIFPKGDFVELLGNLSCPSLLNFPSLLIKLISSAQNPSSLWGEKIEEPPVYTSTKLT